MASKYSLAEQIIERAKGAPENQATFMDQPSVQLAIGQVVNAMLKLEAFENLNVKEEFGDLVPAGLCMATYENVAINTYKTNYSKLTLPAMPVKLPKDIGCFHIGADPFNSWIPIPQGLFQMLAREPLISDVLGQVAYERNGYDVVFTKNLPGQTPAITSAAFVKLLVVDISLLSEFDPLPIPADMEDTVITEVLKRFGIMPPPNNVVDPVADTK